MPIPTVSLLGKILYILLFVVAMSAFAYIMVRRIQILLKAQPAKRWDKIGQRIASLLSLGFGQRKILSKRFFLGGVIHLAIFWGFIVVLLSTFNFLIRGFAPSYNLPFITQETAFGRIYENVKHVFELLVLVSVIIALIRRFFRLVPRLTYSWEANLILLLIGILMLTDLGMSWIENTILITKKGSWVVRRLGELFPSSIANITLYNILWWLHAVTLLFFFPYLPLSKHFHIITSLPNVFIKSLTKGAVRYIDLENVSNWGVNKFEDFTWKDILDIYSCTECGRCQSQCPAYLSGKSLSPKDFNIDLRNELRRTFPILPPKSKSGNLNLSGAVIDSEKIWACNLCGACEETCPIAIEFIDRIVEMRRNLVLEKGAIPEELTHTFRNLENYGNPWGKPNELRLELAKELKVPVLGIDVDRSEYLLWVGCAGSFEPQAIKTTEAMVKILKSAGINFAVLGSAENCTGDLARRLGNEYLFQTLAKENISNFEKFGVTKILTQCPHCYNTLKNEYPQLGGHYEVKSHLEFIAEVISSNKLSLKKPKTEPVTLHDPCYFARHNGQINEIRFILKALGIKIKEMELSGKNTFCCGGGGGRIWLEESPLQRVNSLRVEQIMKSGARRVVTACPFCITMLSDGLKEKELAGELDCKEITWLVAEAL